MTAGHWDAAGPPAVRDVADRIRDGARPAWI